jgi:predicted DNA-binding protein
MISLDLPVEAENQIATFARLEQLSPECWLLRKVLEHLEDEADARLIEERWHDVQTGKSKTYSSKEMRSAVGL